MIEWERLGMSQTKIGDKKETFHAKMGTIEDRNGIDLTEAEYTQKRWQESTEELYKTDNHDGVITHLEQDILECEVKWAVGSIMYHYEQSRWR